MKLETFFEKFELFADAPNAVGKLRGLVLQLAVQGRLVDQSNKDEPASEMLQRLGGRQPLLLASPHLPTNWACVALGELITLQKGKKPSSLNTEGVGFPYLDIAALERGDLRQFTEDVKCPRATAGDLVIVCDGSRSGLVLDGLDGVLGSTVSKVGYIGLARDYLKIFLRSLYDDLNGAKKGAAIPHLNIPRLLAISAPIPPLTEQRRIVAKVDELMALCDRLEAQQQERDTRHAALARASLARFAEAPTSSNLDFLFHKSYPITPTDLRKTILAQAVQGKLVPQDPNDESATESVRIAREQAQLPVRSHLPVEFNDKPFDIPNAWTWVTVSDVAESRLGKMLDKEKNRGDAHPYLRNTNVHWFRFELDSIKTMLFDPSELAEYRVEPGDVLICEGGHGIARSAVWGGQIPGVMFQKALHRVRPLQCLSGHFLAFCLRVYEDAGILQRYYTGAGIPHFTGKALAKVTFPLPPLNEQLRIVAKVDQLMALVDQLEVQITASRATAEKLMEALVTELSGSGGACQHEQVAERQVTRKTKAITA